ncbi:MAG: hypothetical protein LBM95_04100 [Lactobacillales bacterium]|jgi:hypothetical protein|nr:hypothetical protein [Lactobacillales bacterium]
MVNEMIHENNRLREKLNPENKRYYENLLLYIRTAGLFYNEDDVESTLVQILLEIISAQKNGVSTLDCFGKISKEKADKLIRGFGKASKKSIFKLVLFIFAISSVFLLVNVVAVPNANLNLFVVLMCLLVSC